MRNTFTLNHKHIVIFVSDVDSAKPILMISGPNAGGKSVILKMVGLLVLMVRHGIPLPVGSGSRVDVFQEVIADLGDLQNVTHDLSSYSGHLSVCKVAMNRIANQRIAGGHSLVIMDEIGTGTEPILGEVLAQAILEEMICDSPSSSPSRVRVLVSTHSPRLKHLSLVDPKMTSGAMEIEDGIPTYNLVVGVGAKY